MGNKLNGWFVSGFAEGESYFVVRPAILGRNNKLHRGFNLRWGISLREDDLPLLHKIDDYFGNIGTFTQRKDTHGLMNTSCYYIEGAKKGLEVVKHFDQFPMHGKKAEDYQYYREIVLAVSRKYHLISKENYYEVVALADRMRLNRLKGLRDKMSYSDALRRSSGSGKLYLEILAEAFPEEKHRIDDIVQPMLKDIGFVSLSE